MKTMLTAILATAISASAWAQDGSYVEIPVKGVFGKDFTASALGAALAAAKDKGIKHVVFTVDSKGGIQLAGGDVYRMLSKYDKAFSYHAIVKEATGVALAVVVWCDNVFVQGDAKLGGVNLVVDENKYAGIEPMVVMSHIALNAGEDAKRHGQSAELVRAMIDPTEPVFAWKGADGKPVFGRSLPPDTAKDAILLEHPGKKVLTLTAEQALALGFARKHEGDAQGLGAVLKISGWKPGTSVQEAMAHATQVEVKKNNEAMNDREAFLINQNQKRREATKAAIDRFLGLANQWNPKAGTYSTYKEGGWDGFWHGDGYDTGRLTPEARRQWRDRTDITVSALSKAFQGVKEMKELEKEAKGLKQEPMFPEGKLNDLQVDLALKIDMLEKERQKRYMDNK